MLLSGRNEIDHTLSQGDAGGTWRAADRRRHGWTSLAGATI